MPLVLEGAHALQRNAAAERGCRATVTSIPSFTRSGRPSSASARARPPGSTSTALRVSSARPMERESRRQQSATSRAAFRTKAGAQRRQAPAPHPQASPLRPPLLVPVRAGSLSFTFGLVTADRAASSRQLDPARLQQPRGRRLHLRLERASESSRCCAARRAAILVDSNDIAPVMKQAIVAIEDKRFYEHRGVDIHGILRAVWQDVRNKQVVAGRLDDHAAVRQEHLREEPALDRPQAEGGGARLAARAALVEGPDPDRLPEHDLLRERRLRRSQQAALTYFDHGAAKLTLGRGGAARRHPERPVALRPGHEPEGGAASGGAIVLAGDARPGRHHLRRVTRREQGAAAERPRTSTSRATRGPGAVLHELRQAAAGRPLRRRAGSSAAGCACGRRSTSTSSSFARQAITKWLTDPNGPSAALVAIDPRDGSVLAMVGGNNYRKSQFNLAVQGERQPGSSFKPFVLATALKDGISPDDRRSSRSPCQIPLGDKHLVRPQLRGLVPRARSPSTTATVELRQHGLRAADAARRPGERSSRRRSKLGHHEPAEELLRDRPRRARPSTRSRWRAPSPPSQTAGLRIDGAAFGNHPRAISVVRNEAGRMVDNNLPVRRHAADREHRGDRQLAPARRRARRARASARSSPDGRPVAGKTGTTENYGDAWFVGYTPQLVTAVWVGYPTS